MNPVRVKFINQTGNSI